jgi:SRSO17 transposase
MLNRLIAFSQPFVSTLGRVEIKKHAHEYLEGLLSDLERKNVESIAYQHDQDRQGLQRFVGVADWDHAPMVDILADEIGQTLGEEDGVIVFDPSGFPKCGRNSVGVKRQWLGRLGKIDNGQVGIYMGYATRVECALVDVRLYLPKDWAQDKARRTKAGVPNEIRFKTRHQLALEMLEAHGSQLPHRWITGDDEMGRPAQFRRELQKLGEQYILATPSNTSVRDLDSAPPEYSGRGRHPKQPFQQVRHWAEAQPSEAWSSIEVRPGEKGPLTLEIMTTRVLARAYRSRQDAGEELLIVTRYKDSSGKCKYDYYVSNSDPTTPLKELSRVIITEHRIEELFRRAKGEAGLADYEVRKWDGWYHHQTLSMIALWFLTLETLRGKKIHAWHNRFGDTRSTRIALTPVLRSSSSGLGKPLHREKKYTSRTGSILSL